MKKWVVRVVLGEADGATRYTATEDNVAAKVVDKLLEIQHKRREILQTVRNTHTILTQHLSLLRL